MKPSKTIIDVRTPGEFRGGNASGSINIPLNEIHLHLDEIKKMPQPLILCCASGNRSSQATILLRSKGIACENGGSWYNLQK
jgi:rhodanese-related sulfurtransferase